MLPDPQHEADDPQQDVEKPDAWSLAFAAQQLDAEVCDAQHEAVLEQQAALGVQQEACSDCTD